MLSQDQIKSVPEVIQNKAIALAEAYANGHDTQREKESLYTQARAVFTLNNDGIPSTMRFFPSIQQSRAHIPWGETDHDPALSAVYDTGTNPTYDPLEEHPLHRPHAKLEAFLNAYVSHIAQEHGLRAPKTEKYFTGALNVTPIMEQKATRLAELMNPASPTNALGDIFQQREREGVQKALYFYARAANGHLVTSHSNKKDAEKTLKALLNDYVTDVAVQNKLAVPQETPYLPAAAALHVG